MPDPINSPMDIAVTGAYGHLGVNLVHRLVSDGHSVRAVDVRRTAALDSYNIDHIHADTTDVTALASALDGAEVIYHLAARISVAGDPDGSVWHTNVDGTGNVGRAALSAGVRRFVHVSSIHALNVADDMNDLTENSSETLERIAPVYDRSKAAGERFLQALIDEGLDAVVIRPSALIGPGDHDVSRMGAFMRATGGGRMHALVGGGFDWVDVRDVASGMVVAAERGETGRRYLLGGHFATLRDLAELIAVVTGRRPPRVSVPIRVAQLIGRPGTWWARRTGSALAPTAEALRALKNGKPVDYSLAGRELEYRPRPLQETIRDFFVWLDEAAPSTSR